jgi:L-amino acid N-acyltransferase YncA
MHSRSNCAPRDRSWSAHRARRRFPTNAAGRRLYERRGFYELGTYREQGLLDGRWVDVLLMEKLLG